MLYARGIRPEHILTMTYTVAATCDMRERFASYNETLVRQLIHTIKVMDNYLTV